jgi:hypothetical protein
MMIKAICDSATIRYFIKGAIPHNRKKTLLFFITALTSPW